VFKNKLNICLWHCVGSLLYCTAKASNAMAKKYWGSFETNNMFRCKLLS
jgi:hypothetical protein